MVGFMESKHSVLLKNDSTWLLKEKQLEALGSDAGALLLEQLLLECLPKDVANAWDASVALDK
eukprot:10417609-Lingulodinium_polyedra.AAC.1